MANASTKRSGVVMRLIRWSLRPPTRQAPGWIKRRFARRSPVELRADDKARQAGVRRELRGLPTRHDRDSGHHPVTNPPFRGGTV